MSVFIELSIVVFIAAILALIMKMFKQPVVVGYILSGFIAGPVVLNLVKSEETLELFSKIGITVLLFIIGLHLKPQVIKEVGGISLVTGLGQIVFTTLGGLLISLVLGFGLVESLFIAVALTFSSTIIVLKLLHDKGDLDKLYGKIATGFLLVQDIAASIFLLAVSLLASTAEGDFSNVISIMILRLIALFIVIYVFSRWVLPSLTKFAADSSETLFLFCLTWGMGVASLFSLAGLSVEIGALVAGLSLSATGYASEVASRLRPLRDFFIVILFILLGSHMVVSNITANLVPAMVMSLFVLIGNPLIVFMLMNVLNFHKRTSFLAGLTVAQISEFSLIFVSLGRETGYVNDGVISLVTLVGLITIAVSSYLIMYAEKIYPLIANFLSMISIKKHNHDHVKKEKDAEIMLVGYGRVGPDYVKMFEKLDKRYFVIDFNPEAIQDLVEQGIPAMYGDIEDIEFLDELPLDKLKMIISNAKDFEADSLLVKATRKVNKKAIIIVKSNNLSDAENLYQLGASYVVMPHYLGAHYAVRMIKRLGFTTESYAQPKTQHLAFIASKLH